MFKAKGKSKSGEEKIIFDIIIRYSLAFLASLGSFWIFYAIFTPLTFYPSAFILKLIYNASIENPFIFIGENTIFINKACVAGSAYALLFLLNMASYGILWTKRAKILLFNFSSLLVLNILRIGLLAILLIILPELYDITHFIFWHVMSIVFVVGIWLFTIKLFKIKAIPFFSDFMNVRGMIKKK